MDPKLREVIEHWREERCPPRVLQQVRAQLAHQPDKRSYPLLAWLVPAATIPLLALGIALYLSPPEEPVKSAESVAAVTDASPSSANKEAAELALLSLTYMGSVLLDSTKQVESQLQPARGSQFHEPYLRFRAYLQTTQYQ